ncbi:hypothetical protein IMSHALPRED_004077 [Imshaugia aleurites]|uniref:Uncharacterized protein n=1 Tax=Imshaugia aleurites TaxID=172621 RepID=A0A8H3I608_9LECA|nr:hypothetical protein IMSHALPRED_004077 [Imshaugia aleurites]
MALIRDEPFILTPIDNILPRYYVSKLFLFPSSRSVATTDTIEALTSGLEKTVQAFPLLAGTVDEIQPATSQEQRGRLCVSAPWHTMSEMFSVEDLTTNHALDYSELRAAGFPIHKFDAATLLPQETQSGLYARCVMLVKVNKIKGGLIVVHSLSHGFMDGGGMAVVVKIWAAFCRGEDGARYLTPEVLDRSHLMHGKIGSEVADFPELTHARQDPPAQTSTPGKKQELQYETFFFSRQMLAELKTMASVTKSHSRSNDWISTSDALCALITHCIKGTLRERTRLTLGLAMDFRSYLDPPLPADYIGNAVHMLRMPLPQSDQEDDQQSLGRTAHLIRQKIQTINDDYILRVIGALNSRSLPDISKVFHTRTCLNDGQFLTITSWAKQEFYELNWGSAVGTRIERVRMCKFQYPNLVLIAPMFKGPGFSEEEAGGIEVVFGLKEVAMSRLKENRLLERFARWEGK